MGGTLGVITTEYTVWCGRCCDWNQIANKKSVAIRIWRKNGWKKTEGYGWTCPSCCKTLEATCP